MATYEKTKRRPRHVRPKDELQHAAKRLQRIQKLLLALKAKSRDVKPSGNEWDVLKNVRAAIFIAEFGQSASAEDAINAADQVEAFWLLIEMQIDRLLAQLGQAR